MADQRLPTIVSIATLPSRIGGMRPTLQSLFDGDLVPDRILVVVTDYSNREKSPYVIPDFLQDERFTRGLIEVVLSSSDWGPGTKLLGALEHIEDDCHLILADDDVAYQPYFLSTLVNAQSKRRDCSFSYFTYRAGGLTVGQGCDGYSFYSPNLTGVQEFVEENVAGTTLHYHDDLWISFFLYKRGIKVRKVSPPDEGLKVYTQTIADEGLSNITSGDRSRERIVSEGLPRLARQGGLTRSQKAHLSFSRFSDGIRHLPARMLNRARILVGSKNAKV